MKLILTIANVDRLDNNASTRLTLDRHGALIGRSPTADWSLPDPKNYISFSHCEIAYVQGRYVLTDRSTNGTFLNGSRERLNEPHTLQEGDEFAVGHYRIRAELIDERAKEEPVKEAVESKGWSWNDAAPAGKPASVWDTPTFAAKPARQWTFEEPAAAITGRGAASQNFAPPRATSPPPIDDVWTRFADSNRIDWSQNGASQTPTDKAMDWPTSDQTRSTARPLPPESVATPVSPAPSPDLASTRTAPTEWLAFIEALGLQPSDIRGSQEKAAETAGKLLHQLVAGLVVMLDARARAKRELGAQTTMIELNGNNPLKFLRNAEAATTKLLNPPERGFMDSDRAVDDAFKDLQAHQMATLLAMQNALRTTLKRFSPEAIRARADQKGLLARILPGARAAALWEAYEHEFEGVVHGSDEAFMDVFAKAFRDAYQKACAEMRR
jgi:type VI secretion system FHA domain protein